MLNLFLFTHDVTVICYDILGNIKFELYNQFANIFLG